jgi:hypothetical protein
MPNISTYRRLLLSIQESELAEESSRKLFFLVLCGTSLVALVEILLFIFFRGRGHLNIPPELIGTALIPLASIIYASWQRDHITQTRSELLNSILSNFNSDNIQAPQFGDGPLKFDELRMIIFKLLENTL